MCFENVSIFYLIFVEINFFIILFKRRIWNYCICSESWDVDGNFYDLFCFYFES